MKYSLTSLLLGAALLTLPCSASAAADDAGTAEEGLLRLPLDSCRAMALRTSKALKMADAGVEGARHTKRAAAAAYLPSIDAGATYFYNQHKTSLLSEDAKLPTMQFDPATGKYEYNLVTGPDGAPVKDPATGSYIPSTVALIPKEAMTFDTRSVFAGVVTLTQPVYMGGSIRALNQIARFTEEALSASRRNAERDLLFSVDESYWTMVSLEAKQRLAESFVQVVDSLRGNVQAMLEAGVATRADLLSVDVRLNEARIMLQKVENGLSLSRMALAQLCGLPADTPVSPAEGEWPATEEGGKGVANVGPVDMQDVYAQRQDLEAVRLGIGAMRGAEKLALSSMLPKLGITGAYSFSTPNLINGFNRHIKGGFSVGAALTVPIWHWGGDYNKYRAAKAATRAQQLLLEDLEEKVTLQVRQARYKYEEAFKTYDMAESNLASATENLRCARDGYNEGVLTTNDVLAAQTGWLQARSEIIDAGIGIRLCRVYLDKVLGLEENAPQAANR